ncbi:hypothetical protein WN51_05724 [Melipona quadrifasciata]|uniref:Uncharacterized protein n=1 Tax=Melipona quadrifasciata TaxID=166423 RepID=A0A0N0BIL4_9HYME|nr:hypothetical protein WN51_05724 [Melipona quadrifasciata]
MNEVIIIIVPTVFYNIDLEKKISSLGSSSGFSKRLENNRVKKKPLLTVIVVFREIGLVDEEIVIPVKLPKLAIDHVEMLVAEVGSHLIDVLLVLEDRDHRQQVAPPQLCDGDSPAPASVHAVEYPGDHLASKFIERRQTSITNINSPRQPASSILNVQIQYANTRGQKKNGDSTVNRRSEAKISSARQGHDILLRDAKDPKNAKRPANAVIMYRLAHVTTWLHHDLPPIHAVVSQHHGQEVTSWERSSNVVERWLRIDFSGSNPENRASSGATLMQRKLIDLGHVIRKGVWDRPRVGMALSGTERSHLSLRSWIHMTRYMGSYYIAYIPIGCQSRREKEKEEQEEEEKIGESEKTPPKRRIYSAVVIRSVDIEKPSRPISNFLIQNMHSYSSSTNNPIVEFRRSNFESYK